MTRSPLRLLLCAALLLGAAGCDDKVFTPPESTCPGMEQPGPALADTALHLMVAHDRAETWRAFRETPQGIEAVEGRGLLGRAPNDLEFARGVVYALNSQDNSLQFIDPRSGETTGCLDLGTGTGPWDLALDPFDPDRGWIVTFTSGEILEVDLSAGDVLRRTVVGQGLEGLWVGESMLAVTLTGFLGSEGFYGPGSLVLMDKSSLKETARMAVPANAQQVLEAPDGRLHVVCTGNYGQQEPPVWGQVVRTDPAWSAVTDTLALGGTPGRALPLPGGAALVTGWFGGLLAYDMTTFTLIRGTDNPVEGSSGYTDAVVTGRAVYASNFDLDAILVLDPGTLAITGSVLTGDGPAALVAIPKGSMLD